MKRFFIFLFLTGFISAHSQNKFSEGYIVSAKGDTLHGLVRWQDQHVLFKFKESDDPSRYRLDELTASCNNSSDKSVKLCQVEINFEYIDFEYNIKLKDTIKAAKLPMRLIYQGNKLALYEFRGTVNYYFLFDGNNYYQLTQNYRYLTERERATYHDPVPKYFISYNWHNVLARFYDFSKDKRMHYEMENTNLDASSLRKLIAKIDRKVK